MFILRNADDASAGDDEEPEDEGSVDTGEAEEDSRSRRQKAAVRQQSRLPLVLSRLPAAMQPRLPMRESAEVRRPPFQIL